MSKELLNKLKAGVAVSTAPELVKPVENAEPEKPVAPVQSSKSDQELPVAAKKEPAPKKGAAKQKSATSGLTGLEELYEILKEEKQDFTFNKRLVYIDDDLADILDLLKKEAKINSNLLTSHLLKNFCLENIELIKALKEKKKSNKFLK